MSYESVTTATSQWLATSLRLTAFPVTPGGMPRAGMWADVVGREPDTQNVQLKNLQVQEYGLIELGQLHLNSTPVMIDWRLEVPEKQVLDLIELPSIGTMEDAFRGFEQLIASRFLGITPDLQRIAFGAELLIFADNHITAYEQLNRFLPFDLDPNSSDFFYQINRKRPSRSITSELIVNRLSKWHSIKLALGVQSRSGAFELPGLETFASRLELDINTDASFQGALPYDQLSVLFTELVELGREIAQNGDIP